MNQSISGSCCFENISLVCCARSEHDHCKLGRSAHKGRGAFGAGLRYASSSSAMTARRFGRGRSPARRGMRHPKQRRAILVLRPPWVDLHCGCGHIADTAVLGFRANTAKRLILLARSEGFEPPTPRFEVWCSIQLSYERTAVSLAKTPADSKQLRMVEAQRLRRSRKATRSR
jgi:hypothetical protein